MNSRLKLNHLAWFLRLSVIILLLCSEKSLSAQEPREFEQDVHNAPGSMANQALGASMPGADPFHLIMNSQEVQHYLQLTDTQLSHLSSIGKNFRQQVQESSFGSKNEVQQQIESGQQMIKRVLTPEQNEKLKQIVLQIVGPCGILSDPQSMEHIQIEPASPQYQQIETICSKASERIFKLASNSNQALPRDECAARAAIQKQSQEIKTSAQEQVEQILTASQRAILNEMKGAPMALPLRPPLCN